MVLDNYLVSHGQLGYLPLWIDPDQQYWVNHS